MKLICKQLLHKFGIHRTSTRMEEEKFTFIFNELHRIPFIIHWHFTFIQIKRANRDFTRIEMSEERHRIDVLLAIRNFTSHPRRDFEAERIVLPLSSIQRSAKINSRKCPTRY